MPPKQMHTSQTFADLWQRAVQSYIDKAPPSAVEALFEKSASQNRLLDCTTPEEVTSVLICQEEVFRAFRGKDKKLGKFRSKLQIAISMVWKFGDAVADVTKDALPGVGGGIKIVFVAIGVLLQAAKGVSEMYDGLEDLLADLGSSLGRFRLYLELPAKPNIKLQEIIVDILAALLEVLALSTKYTVEVIPRSTVRQWSKRVTKRLKRYGLALSQDEETKKAAEKLKKLTEDEDRIRGVLTFVATAKMEAWTDDQKIKGWLKPVDPRIRHDIVSRLRAPRTGSWLLNSVKYSGWKSGYNAVFWLRGKPGSGKSVLCSTVVDDLRQADCLLAFYYFNFRTPSEADAVQFLSSIAYQMACQSSQCMSRLEELFLQSGKGRYSATVDGLLHCLRFMLNTTLETYIVVDALDECPERQSYSGIFSALKSLLDGNFKSLHFLITSREERDIVLWFDRLAPVLNHPSYHVLQLHSAEEQKQDIKSYVSSQLPNAKHYDYWSQDMQLHVRDALVEKSNGMFLWVALQLPKLYECTQQEVQQALESLPTTLEETYCRILQHDTMPAAREAFCFAAFASRPLSPLELAAALTIDWKWGQTTAQDLRSPTSFSAATAEDFVLRLCSSLLEVVGYEVPEGEVYIDLSQRRVQFVHASIRDYLVADELYIPKSILPHLGDREEQKLKSFHLRPESSAHASIARLCLYTLLSDEDISSLPFWDYASDYWDVHVRALNLPDLSELVDLLDRFLCTNSPYFLRWAGRNISPLYAIASTGIDFLVIKLLTGLSSSITSLRGPLGTPLHVAAARGNFSTLQILINAELNTHLDRMSSALDDRKNITGAAIAWTASHNTTTLVRNRTSSNTEGVSSHIADLNLENAKVDLDCASFINTRNRAGETPLHLASNAEIARFLLDRGAIVNARSDFDQIPLHSSRDLNITRLLVERGAEVDARDDSGLTPLMYAAGQGDVAISRFLLEHGASVDGRDDEENTPLICAHSDDVSRLLLEHGADANARNKLGRTILHSTNGASADIALRFLNSGVHVDTRDEDGLTPLHWTRDVEVAQILIEHGADVNARDNSGTTPLHRAAAHNIELVRLLLKHGALVDARDARGRTPLFRVQHSEVFRVLKEHGANLEVRDNEDYSLLHCIGNVRAIRLLLQHGLSVDAYTKQGQTPLHVGRNINAVRTLLEHGAKINARDSRGHTPLHLTWEDAIARVFLEYGADLDSRNSLGWTPLYTTFSPGVAHCLLGAGANLTANFRDKSGQTPLHITRVQEVASRLLEQGLSISDRDYQGNTPLHGVGNLGDGVRFLLEQQASACSLLNLEGLTGAHHAILRENESLLKLFIVYGADIRRKYTCHGSVRELAYRMRKAFKIREPEKNFKPAVDIGSRLPLSLRTQSHSGWRWSYKTVVRIEELLKEAEARCKRSGVPARASASLHKLRKARSLDLDAYKYELFLKEVWEKVA